MGTKTMPDKTTPVIAQSAYLDAEARAQRAEARVLEQAEIMVDLLNDVGIQDNCAKCGGLVYWVRQRRGATVIYSPDGAQHWPRCPQTPRPEPGENNV